ncbi:MAG TPA: NUDIX hydrolase [Opitutaceae bacterium]
MTEGAPARWVREGERTLASTRILDLRSVKFRRPGKGDEREFVVIHSPDWVNVVAVTPVGHVVLVRQFRFGADAISLEVPGGVIEKGEDPVAAGLRELLEETGYGGGNARLLGSVHPNPAIQDNHCHFVVVEGAVPTGPMKWDDDEDIAVSTAPLEQALEWARDGTMTHSLSVAALLLFGSGPRI